MRGLRRIAAPGAGAVCLCVAALAAAAAGQLDRSFSGNGKLTTAIGSGDDDAGAIAIDSKGRIVAAGSSFNGADDDFAVARYKPNGKLDRSFSGDGKVITALDGSDGAEAVAIDGKDRVVAVGHSLGSADRFALVRYKASGKLDRTFSGDGKASLAVGAGAEATSVAIDSKGRIVAAGSSYNGADDDFALARFKPSGKLDHSFSGDGRTTTGVGPATDYLAGLAIDRKGRIVAAGYTTTGSGDEFALARFKPNGGLDGSFSGDGKLTTPIGATADANAVGIDGKGRIVAAGFSSNGTDDDFAVARYTPSGKLDQSFSGDGKTTLGLGPSYDDGRSMTIDRRNRIIVCGRSSNGANTDFGLARLKPSGKPDNSFSDDGRLTTSLGPGDDFAKSVQVDSQGRIVAGGRSFNGTDDDFALARYKG